MRDIQRHKPARLTQLTFIEWVTVAMHKLESVRCVVAVQKFVPFTLATPVTLTQLDN